MKSNQKGFSLIEYWIVVAIILIIAAIAIPNLMRSRMAANESSAVGSLRTINTAMVEYAASFPDTGYSLDLVSLGGAVGGCAAGTIATTGAAFLIDPTLRQAASLDTCSPRQVQRLADHWSIIPIR